MAESRARAPQLNELPIADCDVHANHPPQALAAYIDQPRRVSLERLGAAPQRYLDIGGYSPNLFLDPPLPERGRTIRTVSTVDALRADLAEMSIDIGFIFPDFLLRMACLPDVVYAAALGRAYNAWLADQWTDASGGLLGAVMAIPQDLEDAAREIRHYGARPDSVGVYLPVAGVRSLWGDRRYDPIYAAAQELGLPVMLHRVDLIHPNFPFNVEQFTSAPLLEKPPSHYIREMCFYTQPIEEPERRQDRVTMVALLGGADRVLFASDWPHHDFDHPRAVMKAPFSRETKRKSMGENALDLFALERPAAFA